MYRFYMGIIVPSSIIIPLCIALARYQYLAKAMRVIFYYLLVSGCVNAIAVYMAKHRMNNLPLLHLYTIIEFAFISLFYFTVFEKTAIKNTILRLIPVFTGLCVLNAVFLQSIYVYNSYPHSVEALLIMGYSILYLFQSSKTNTNATSWVNNPVSWVNTGILQYFSGALFLFAFSNLITANVHINAIIWCVHATLVLIMDTYFSIRVITCKK